MWSRRRRSAIIEDDRISDLEDRVPGVRSPINTTRALTIPLSVSFFCCLSKTVRVKSLSACRDETLIILRRLSFFKSEWYDPDSTLSQSIVGITAPIDFSIRLKYIHTHSSACACCRHFLLILLNLSSSQLWCISFMFVATGCILDAEEFYWFFISSLGLTFWKEHWFLIKFRDVNQWSYELMTQKSNVKRPLSESKANL